MTRERVARVANPRICGEKWISVGGRSRPGRLERLPHWRPECRNSRRLERFVEPIPFCAGKMSAAPSARTPTLHFLPSRISFLQSIRHCPNFPNGSKPARMESKATNRSIWSVLTHMDKEDYREFAVSNDGSHVAAGSSGGEVCVLRVSDGWRRSLPGVSYSSGGKRLTIDSRSKRLFSGAYHNTGIAAYDIDTGNLIWQRRDLKKLQDINFDSREDVLYCAFEGRASRPLNAKNGRERRPIRGLKGFHFSSDSSIAVFELGEVKVEDRSSGTSQVLKRESWAILDVAFALNVVVVSWVGGPVVSYLLKTGKEVWRYPPEGTHAFSIAPSSDGESVWIAEQPFKEPPWHRIRLLSNFGRVLRETRCALGHSFRLLPNCDKVIRADLNIVAIDALGAST
ncbi:MAG: hypothetical protein L6R28_00445 [Planctomycetes bacterium]|nr:hypothetical protein [Planctomycetota bacterium]